MTETVSLRDEISALVRGADAYSEQDQELYDSIADDILAAMLEREARVKVKPLVWVDHTGLSVARLKCGLNYGVFPVADGKSFSVYLEGLPCEESDDSVCMWSKDLSGNIEAAKAAAQEHYEAAILSAIEEPGHE